jgi:hypothetical protein
MREGQFFRPHIPPIFVMEDARRRSRPYRGVDLDELASGE